MKSLFKKKAPEESKSKDSPSVVDDPKVPRIAAPQEESRFVIFMQKLIDRDALNVPYSYSYL